MTTETITMTDIGRTIHPRWVRICHWINALADLGHDRVRLADLQRLTVV